MKDFQVAVQFYIALDQLAADSNDELTANAPVPLRLFVPQSIATLLRREWVLWMRDRLLEKHLLACTLIVVPRADDLVAHLGVANALFRLLASPECAASADTMSIWRNSVFKRYA